jgi:hypothetical protein
MIPDARREIDRRARVLPSGMPAQVRAWVALAGGGTAASVQSGV